MFLNFCGNPISKQPISTSSTDLSTGQVYYRFCEKKYGPVHKILVFIASMKAQVSQICQSFHFSHTQSYGVDEGLDQILDLPCWIHQHG